MNLEIRKLNQDEIKKDLFCNFTRHQVVRDCWRHVDGQWVIKEDPFIDDWSAEDYAFLVDCLKNTAAAGGVVYGVFVEDTLKGFVSVEGDFIGSRKQYADLTSIHVSEELRGHGIGKKLFFLAADWARERGAEKLYLSAHSAVESQAFYRALGCVEAEEYSDSHVRQEPYDCQLEYLLERQMENAKINSLYNLNETIAKDLFEGLTYPWEALAKIGDFIRALGPTLDKEKFEQRGEDIWVAKSADIAPTAFLNGPLIIDEDAEIRHCAFVRGSAIVGKGAVVGNSTELKNAVLFNKVQVPHYNYVGDSILGYKSHMGAGSITSNVKSDKTLVVVKGKEEEIKTGLKKMGAMLGDYVEIGCNSVLNPGTVIGPNSNVYPLSSVRGVVPAYIIYKERNEIIKKCR